LASDLLPFLSAEAGYQLSHLSYQEPSLNVGEKGWLHGIYLRATLHAPAGLMLRAEGDLSQGTLDYDGSTWSGAALTSRGSNRLTNARLLVGWDLSFPSWALTPYAGLGWRDWRDRQDGAGFYTRETTCAYVPLGAEVNLRLAPGWRLRLLGEVDFWLGGRNQSRLSEADPGFNDIQVDQGQGWGWLVSAGLSRDLGPFALRLEPFFWYWEVKQSDSQTLYWYNLRLGTAFEPDNNSTTWGLRLTLEF
jgi:hypothetical protein